MARQDEEMMPLPQNAPLDDVVTRMDSLDLEEESLETFFERELPNWNVCVYHDYRMVFGCPTEMSNGPDTWKKMTQAMELEFGRNHQHDVLPSLEIETEEREDCVLKQVIRILSVRI